MCITNPLKISDFQGNLLHMLLFSQKHAFYFSILRIKEGLSHVQQPRIPRPNAPCVGLMSSIGHGREAARKAAIWRVCGAVWRREPYNLTLESKTYYTQNYDTMR